MGLEAVPETGKRGMLQAIFLHLEPVLQLAPAGHQVLQFLLPRRAKGRGCGFARQAYKARTWASRRSVLAAMPAPRARLRTSLGLMKQAGNAASRKAARRRNS